MLKRLWKLFQTSTFEYDGYRYNLYIVSKSEKGRKKNFFKETETFRWITKNQTKADVFIDVGANIGQFTLLAHKVGYKTYAFEPNLKCFLRLTENLRLNNFPTDCAFPFGVTQNEEISKINIPVGRDSIGSNRATVTKSPTAAAEICGKSIDYSYNIPTIRLDSVIKLTGGKRFIIKIDVDGTELEVIQSLGDYLGATDTVVSIAVEQNNLPDLQRDAVTDLLLQSGFVSSPAESGKYMTIYYRKETTGE